jgi:hypothetical protein
VVGLAQPQVVEEHLVEQRVVVLPGVHENVLGLGIQSLDRRGEPDDLGSRAHDGHRLGRTW